MERRLVDKIDDVRQATVNLADSLGTEIKTIQLQCARFETRDEDMTESKGKVVSIDERLSSLERWHSGFIAEKAERDRRAEANEALVRRVAGGLIIAVILAAGGCVLTLWQQHSMLAQMVEMVEVQARPREAPTPEAGVANAGE